MKLTDFKILTFDVYGTLIDWETGIVQGLLPLTDQVRQGLTRDQILNAHAYYESTTQRSTPGKPYQQLLATVYRRLAEEWQVEVAWEECLAYGQSVRDWPAFEDSPAALAYLKKHYKLAVLTNVDNDSFMHSNAKLGVNFDAIYTAEDIGSYKPADRNFDYMLDNLHRLGIDRADILHTAESMFHDHQPARKFSLANCHIYRRFEQPGFGATMTPGEVPDCDFQFHSMAELVEAHRRQVQ